LRGAKADQYGVGMRYMLAAASALLLASAARAEGGRPQADLIVWGGPIYTADDAHPRVDAVAVRGGRIVWAGDRAGAEALKGPGSQVIDLRGAALYPGFTDAHAHLLGIGERELTLDLAGQPSIEAVKAKVKAWAAGMPAGAVLWGRGWIETHWPEHRFLTRQDLDAIAPDRPVLLVRADGHALVANTLALKRAGIGRNTAAPSGGAILKDASGEPTGMLVDAAMSLVGALVPQPSPEQKDRAYRAAFRVYASRGWTGLHNMSVDYDDAVLLEGYARQGELPLRVYNAVTPEGAERLIQGGPRSAADGRVITRTLKFYMDGALGSRGAALFEPYDDAATTGLIKMEHDRVLPVWEAALKRGVQVTTHAIGDRANHMALDWYAEAFKAVPPSERAVAAPRWRIEHAQILQLSDIPRFAKLGVIPSMQPSHAIGDLDFAPARLGEARLAGAYAWKSLIKAGSIIPGGTDAPVERGDPLIEFYAAVARKALDGHSGPDWHPEQAVDRATALKMFTAWPAYASFRENELGEIKPGERADLSVFSVDLMTAAEPDILKGRALMTVLDGKVAWRADGW
jgi:predicted amidohydrolase YtcJ